MTKVRITGLEKATAQMKLKISSAIARSNFKEGLKEELVKEVRDNGIKPALKSSTIKRRGRLEETNTTHPSYSRRKSNLTFTGQLLDSLTSKYITSKLQFIISPKKTRRKAYVGVRGKRLKGSSTNYDVMDGQIKKYRRDIAQVFTRQKFLNTISNRLKKAVRQFYK